MTSAPPSPPSATPRVTVLAAIYQDGRFVREAIQSVLRQTFSDFEYLIVNDGAIDDSREIAASFDDPRIRIIDNPANIGLTKSLNVGLAQARGELIARFDSNDVCFADRLAKQVAFLDAHSDVAAVGVQALFVDTGGRPVLSHSRPRPVSEAAIRWCSVFGSPLLHQGTMFRTKVVRDELGGYNEEFRVGQDWELWYRILDRYRIANLPDVLMAVRTDATSISGDHESSRRAGHVERWTPVLATRASDLLKMDVSPELSRLYLELFHPGRELTPQALDTLMHALGVWHRRFLELWPEGRSDRDLRSHVAEPYEQVVFRLAQKRSVRMLRAYGRLFGVDFRAALRAIPRMVAWFCLGPSARRVWRKLRSVLAR